MIETVNIQTIIKALKEKRDLYISRQVIDLRYSELQAVAVSYCIQLLEEMTEGYVLVPKEPSREMLDNAIESISDTEYQNWTGMTYDISEKVYKAILTASTGEE